MHRLWKIFFVPLVVFILFVTVAVFSSCAESPSAKVAASNTPTATSTFQSNSLVGKPELDFTAESINGSTVSLSSFKGKPVLINFWATWCPPCRGEMPIIQQIQDEYTPQGLQILEVNDAESLQNVKSFITENHYSFPVLLDPNGAIGQRYGVMYIPTSFFIDKNGIIRDVVVGAFPNKTELETHLSKIMR